MRVEPPFREVTLPRPRPTSGLFPAAVEPAPRPTSGTRLRRAVALTVVLGTVSLLAYASWHRAAHASTNPTAGSLSQ